MYKKFTKQMRQKQNKTKKRTGEEAPAAPEGALTHELTQSKKEELVSLIAQIKEILDTIVFQ